MWFLITILEVDGDDEWSWPKLSDEQWAEWYQEMYGWLAFTPRYQCNEVVDLENDEETPEVSNSESLVPESQEVYGFDESLRFPGWDFDGGVWPQEASETPDLSNLA